VRSAPHAEPLPPFAEFAPSCGRDLQETLERGTTPHEVSLALVRELRREKPTILVLEDVHWADDATLDVRRLLGRANLMSRSRRVKCALAFAVLRGHVADERTNACGWIAVAVERA
jgi:hypothetical protein